MTLQQIKYYIEIVNCGSINKASERLFVSQPTLSNAIKELESELNLKLLTRTSKGINVTEDGSEFLGYARQIAEQTRLLEQRYLHKEPSRRLFSVSTQHFAFTVNAFVNMVKKYEEAEYEFTIRETKTHEIFEDVKNQRSEIGVLYTNNFNHKVISKILHENHMDFHPLFNAKPHVFVSSSNPLAKMKFVTLKDLEEYPCLTFDQGTYNSFYYSEEILSTISHKKNIRVSDRATIFNLMIGLNGYTISTGIVSSDLNGSDIKSIPLLVDDTITVGWIANNLNSLSTIATIYIAELKVVIQEHGISVF